MPTLTGSGAAIAVVDDPHGYVAPSHGVEIVGRIAHKQRLMSAVLDRVVAPPQFDPRLLELGIKKEVKIEPRIKGKKGSKQRLRGLRP